MPGGSGDLNDPFPEIGLDGLESPRLQMLVQADLLRRHRFALRDDTTALSGDDLGDLTTCRSSVGRHMDHGPCRPRIVDELAQEPIQVAEDLVLDLTTTRSERLPRGLAEIGGRLPAAPRGPARGPPQRAALGGVAC